MKAQGSQASESAQVLTPILAKQPVGVIFDHGNAVLLGQL